MLLFWGTLKPQNGSDIAAVRFSSAVSISAISIFPNGTFPFLNDEELVALTEPSTFELELLFHAQYLPRPDDAKPKQSNALVRTTLAYTGGQREYPLAWDTAVVTRMMILRGQFKTLSIAVYGSVHSGSESSSLPASQGTEIAVDDLPLASALDLVSSFDPTEIARQLLALVSRAPPLTTVLRLILCIKPRKEDWDDPNFPLCENLDGSMPSTVDELLEVLSRPVEASSDSCRTLSRAISSILCQKIDPEDIPRIISLLACQPPELVVCVKKELPPLKIELDDDSQKALVSAAAHPYLAAYLATCEIQASGVDLSSFTTIISQRTILDSALSSESDEMNNDVLMSFSSWPNTILSSERAVGVFVLSLLETSTADHSEPFTFPSVVDNLFVINKRGDLMTSNRLIVGICSVFAVLGWCDSIGDERAIERVLGVLRVWQSITGYSFIVNKLLSLPQFTVRLERLLQTDQRAVPSTCLLAEQILHSMIMESPSNALLNEDVSYTALSLRNPMLGFDDSVRGEIINQAELADGGLDAAIEFLASIETKPIERESFLKLRLALIFVENELQDTHSEVKFKLSGVPAFLAKLLVLFALPTSLSGDAGNGLSNEIVILALRLLPALIENNLVKATDIRPLTRSFLIQTYEMKRSRSPQRCVALSSALLALAGSPHSNRSQKARTVVLNTLIEEGLNSQRVHNAVEFISATIELVQLVLGSIIEDEISETVLPSLDLLACLWSLLDVSQKVICIKAFKRLDEDGLLGLVDWLITTELDAIDSVLLRLVRYEDEALSKLLQVQVDAGFTFLLSILNDNLVESSLLSSSKIPLGGKVKALYSQMWNHGVTSQIASSFAVRVCLSPDLDFRLEVTRFLLMIAGTQIEFLPAALQNTRHLCEDGLREEAFLEDFQRCARRVYQLHSDEFSMPSVTLQRLAINFAKWEERWSPDAPSNVLRCLTELLDQKEVQDEWPSLAVPAPKRFNLTMTLEELDSVLLSHFVGVRA